MRIKWWYGLLVVLVLGIALAAPRNDDPFAAAEKRLRKQLGTKFHYARSGVFVCAGNLEQKQFDAIVAGTVGGCAQAMWRQYFTKQPDYPIIVYLFDGDGAYRAYAKALFNDVDISNFGYYKPDQRALVMNIGTGTGTLVHEMTHALMEPDFPDAPTWFSEGLASLHEQCRTTDAGLVGLVNWRLPILKKGIKDGTTLPLAALLATKREEFLDKRTGEHYAQVRYLCMYLQSHGVLRAYYRAFRDGCKDDPTGAKTLATVCKQPLADLEREWLAWVGKLEQ